MVAASPILPDVIFDQHLAIVAKTGAGKTFTAKGFVERLLDLGRRVCIIDPTGVWWGLKSSADGKRAGYPVAILGGLHGDLPIVETSGAAVAELIATRNLPAIVDLSEMLIGQRHRFVTDFAEALHRLNRQVLHLVIDEADEVAPQNPLPETKRMLHQIDRIVRRGRVRGFRVMMITQRPAVLHKNVLGSANTLIVMRLTLPHDRRAVEDWIKYQADLGQGKDVLATLARLQRGEGWVWSPEHDWLKRVTFPPIKTFDSSRAPEPGDELAAPATLAEVDLSGIRDALAEAERVAAENDPKLLRKRIAELERDARRQQPAETDTVAIERGRALAFAAGKEAGYQAGRLATWHAAADDLHRLEDETAAAIRAVHKRWSDAAIAEQADPPSIPWDGKPLLPPSNPDEIRRDPTPERRRSIAAGALVQSRGRGGAELRILRVLAQRHPAHFTEAQWATLAGMKRSGGTWGTYKSRLRTAGYLDEQGGTFAVTPAGMKAVGELPPAPQGPEEVIAMWKAALGGSPARMIDILMAAYPRAISREQLAARLDMAASGGTFGTYLSRLRSNGLIEQQGAMISLSPTVAEA